MAVNFINRRGQLEAGELASDREWFWTKGDAEIQCHQGGDLSKTISAPAGATVVEVKAIIRNDAAGKYASRQAQRGSTYAVHPGKKAPLKSC